MPPINLQYTASALNGVSITVSSAYVPSISTPPCRGVYVGTSQDLDFTFDGSTWLGFKGCVAGSVLPIQVVGARKSSGQAAPTSGDVIFLY